MQETKETMVLGKVELNLRPMRVKVYEIIDELSDLDNAIWKRLHSQEMRRKIKKIKGLVNAL